MKTKSLKGADGEEVTVMIPESEADIQRVVEMEEEGVLDMDDSFADRPESLPLDEDE